MLQCTYEISMLGPRQRRRGTEGNKNWSIVFRSINRLQRTFLSLRSSLSTGRSSSVPSLSFIRLLCANAHRLGRQFACRGLRGCSETPLRKRIGAWLDSLLLLSSSHYSSPRRMGHGSSMWKWGYTFWNANLCRTRSDRRMTGQCK